MQQRSIIDMDCPTTKYCVSFMTAKLCQIGIQNHIQAWNNHRIPGTLYMVRVQYTPLGSPIECPTLSTLNLLWDSQRCILNVPYFTSDEHYIIKQFAGQHRGVPNQLALENNRAAQIHSSLIPDMSSAISLYEASGGQLGAATGFGVDPLADSPELVQERQTIMETSIPSPEELFGWTVNGVFQPFSDSLKHMIDVSMDLQRFL